MWFSNFNGTLMVTNIFVTRSAFGTNIIIGYMLNDSYFNLI
jgi:hypothetical protein